MREKKIGSFVEPSLFEIQLVQTSGLGSQICGFCNAEFPTECECDWDKVSDCECGAEEISQGYFDGRFFVIGCSCRTIDKYEKVLLNNESAIIDFYRRLRNDRAEQVKHFDQLGVDDENGAI